MADVDLNMLAERNVLSGGAIVNVLRHAVISAIGAGRSAVNLDDLARGVTKELQKEGRAPATGNSRQTEGGKTRVTPTVRKPVPRKLVANP